jgi:ATP-binding cassette subfamily C exporter for protease/lipase
MAGQISQRLFTTALGRLKGVMWSAALFSCAVNILMLTGPLFMLQVYDRVLSSRSVPTLLAMFGLVVLLYVFLGLFEHTRSRILSRAGYKLDDTLVIPIKKYSMKMRARSGVATLQPLRDLDRIRKFLCSKGLHAIFDLPWTPVYLAVIYFLHPWLGILATAGACTVILITLITELLAKKPLKQSTEWDQKDNIFAESAYRNSETIVALGMTDRVMQNWQQLRANMLAYAQQAGEQSETSGAAVKVMRLLMQSAILALGAYLVILQELTAGAMIAASILAGRALSPVDQTIGHWKSFILSRQSYKRLKELFMKTGAEEKQLMALPKPKGWLQVHNIWKLPESHIEDEIADVYHPILSNLQFELMPGDCMGVLGQSGSGKSSLARLLVGLWTPTKGSIRLNGATLDQWSSEDLGKYIGYMPQIVHLLSGTVKQNIARFDDTVKDSEIIEAAKLAGVHDLILRLPKGYNTPVWDGTPQLSGGQIQRLGLARAVLQKPSLVVLDEPNSNLDSDGEDALAKAIQYLRSQDSTVIIMTHRNSAMAAVNRILILNKGKQVAFGEKEETLAKYVRIKPNLKVIS